MKISVIIFLLCFPIHFSFSQEDESIDYNDFKLITPKHSYSLDLSLPVSYKNKTFKGIMQGLCRVGFKYNYHLKAPFSFGLGYSYSFFQINKFKTPQRVIGGMNIHSYFGELSYIDFYSERFGLEFNIKSGYSNFYIYSDSLMKLSGNKYNSKSSVFIEPSLSILVTTGLNSSLKWILGCNIQMCDFSLKDIGILSKSNYPINDIQNIQYFFFGFSFCHYFKQRT